MLPLDKIKTGANLNVDIQGVASNDVYNDPRQIIYTDYTSYMKGFEQDAKQKQEEDELYYNSPVTDKEQKIMEAVGEEHRYYRWSNDRGHSIVVRCELNEGMFSWSKMQEIHNPQ